MTELRGGRTQQQGSNRRGSRTLAGRVSGALDRLGGMIEGNIRENRQRDQAARVERERVNNDRGPVRGRQYVSGEAQRTDVARVNDMAAFMRRNRGMPVPQQREPRANAIAARSDITESIDTVAEANAADARARDASVSEDRPVNSGAELVRGQGSNRRGVLERPFIVRVDNQDIVISDDQRIALSEYVNEHPRAFDTFADWFNAISTIDGVRPDQVSVERIATARRQWSNPRRGLPPPDAHEDQSITPEERLTAESELMRIINRNRATSDRGRSRTVQRASDTDPNARQPILTLPRQIAEAVVARSRLEQEARDLRSQAEARQTSSRQDAMKGDSSKGGDGKDGSKQRRGTIMTPQQVADEQNAQRDQGAIDGVDLGGDQQQVNPFTREPILPVRPPARGQSSGSRALERAQGVGRTNIGGVEVEATGRGVRGRVRF